MEQYADDFERECAILRARVEKLEKVQASILEQTRGRCWACLYEPELKSIFGYCEGCNVLTRSRWEPFWLADTALAECEEVGRG